MPPETKSSLPVEIGRGANATLFLERVGLVSFSPPVRSSDYELCLSNPFVYYLTRRLGLASRFQTSAALSRGSWFHKAFELDNFTEPFGTPTLHARYDRVLQNRLIELGETCTDLGITGTARSDILLREKQDAETALGWYKAASTISIPTYGSFRSYFSMSKWKILGRELRASWTSPSQPEDIGIFDLLLYDQTNNRLWIVDLKTCSESPKLRLSTCTIEFQTQHYLAILHHLLHEGSLRSTFDLPGDCTVGGMMHVAVRKPPLVFGSVDRNCNFTTFTPTRGPNKGVPRQEKEYVGEPVLANYIQRCADWMGGENDYLHLAPERASDPVVNISYSPYSTVFDNDGYTQYNDRLALVRRYARLNAEPSKFPVNPSSLRGRKKLSPWAYFALSPVNAWPHIISEQGLTVRPREQEIPRDEPDDEPGT